MEQIKLFRRRFLPDELLELKDDKILYFSKDVLVTHWNVLKPRNDIAYGISAYFIDLGVKVSKIFNACNDLVYWYCDIIETHIDEETNTYTFNDLLIDVLVYPDGHTEVVDMDEFADMMEQGVINKETGIHALRCTNRLLQMIYSDNFTELTKFIENAEKIAVHA